MLTAKTKCIGILGWPVEHSLSPLMQNSAFVTAGLDYIYVPLPVAPPALAAAIEGLKALGFAGANVTIPHKVKVMPFMDHLDKNAQMAGAVNTIVLKENKLYGYNTDVDGFIRPLLRQKVLLAGKKAIILGAGGAAQAVIWGLIQAGVAEIAIGVRDTAKAKPLIDLFSTYTGISAHQLPSASLNDKLRCCDLLINATPLGMAPHIAQEPPVNWPLLPAGSIVYDLIYTPRQTKFLQQAAACGHVTMNGESMLVEQGAAAFALWTGQPAPLEAMYAAIAAHFV